MSAITLLAKAHNNAQLRLIDDFLKTNLEGLKVEVEPCRIASRGWVQTTVSGEDETIALNYLAGEIGFCPIQLESVSEFSTIRGYIIALDKNKAEMTVDVGVFSPDVVNATIPLRSLQSQLADGRKIAISKLAELFGFAKNLPLAVKIQSTGEGNGHIDAVLAEEQLAMYKNWTKSLLDRLIVLNAMSDDVSLVLNKAKCDRDVVDVEHLGLFEHAVVCKLGTDAVGLIPRIGRSLSHAVLSVFSPRRILQFFEDDSFWLAS